MHFVKSMTIQNTADKQAGPGTVKAFQGATCPSVAEDSRRPVARRIDLLGWLGRCLQFCEGSGASLGRPTDMAQMVTMLTKELGSCDQVIAKLMTMKFHNADSTAITWGKQAIWDLVIALLPAILLCPEILAPFINADSTDHLRRASTRGANSCAADPQPTEFTTRRGSSGRGIHPATATPPSEASVELVGDHRAGLWLDGRRVGPTKPRPAYPEPWEKFARATFLEWQNHAANLADLHGHNPPAASAGSKPARRLRVARRTGAAGMPTAFAIYWRGVIPRGPRPCFPRHLERKRHGPAGAGKIGLHNKTSPPKSSAGGATGAGVQRTGAPGAVASASTSVGWRTVLSLHIQREVGAAHSARDPGTGRRQIMGRVPAVADSGCLAFHPETQSGNR
eukprot:g5548.t1